MSRKDVNKKFNGDAKNNAKKKIVPNLIVYWIFAVLRIILTLLPQSGYIHPDEYFQSIEVIAGDRFDIDVYKPWEFNVTFPIRSALIPQLLVGIPYTILNVLSPYLWYYFFINVKTPYLLVILPRIFICLLSFISDYCLYKICRHQCQDFRSRLIIFASSYVILVYATHTFSNSIELILVSLLLYYVSRCMIYSQEVVLKSDHILECYENAPNILERVKYYKLQASIPKHSLNDCLVIATITVVGIFNRPTFIAFSFVPIFFWLQRGLGSRSVNFWDFHLRIITFIFYSIPTIIFIIIADSFYYGYLSLSDILNFELGIDNFVVTPLNFIKYNALTKNLACHGLHPRFLHFLINVPLLFNILGVIGILIFVQLIYRISNSRWLELPRIQSVESLMTACFFVPIGILSMFPHQEPRFIIPTLLPLVYLHAPFIEYGHSYKNYNAYVMKQKNHPISRLKLLWFVCNFLLVAFYGFLHQGGVLPLTRHLAKEIRAKPELTHIHLHTSYTYSIPTALLQLRNTKRVYMSSTKHRYQLKQDFFLYEHGSEPMSIVFDAILNKVQECENRLHKQKIPYRIYYAMPNSFFVDFMEYTFLNGTKDIKFQIVNVFYPHISTEKLPSLNLLFFINKITTNLSSSIIEYLNNFGLLLVRVYK